MSIVAVLPAAGKGTRMRPLTRAYPKEGLFYNGDFLINHVLRNIRDSGIKDSIVVTGYRKGALIDMVGAGFSGLTVEFVVQEELRGLGHAVLCSESSVSHFNKPFFAVFLGDNFVEPVDSVKGMIDSHGDDLFASILVEKIKDPGKYGVVKFDPKSGLISGLVEKPDEVERKGFSVGGDFFAVSGVYVLSKEVFDYIRRTPKGKGGEVQLTDALKLALADGRKLRACVLNGKRLDFGNWRSYVDNMHSYWYGMSASDKESLINHLDSKN